MKRVCLPVLGLIILGLGTAPHAADTWIHVIKQTRPSVLLLVYPKAPETSCTGWVYLRRLVVTARHCVIDEAGLWDTRIGSADSSLRLKLVKDWPDDDLAVLEPTLPLVFQSNGLEVAPSMPQMGQSVMGLGYPGLIGDLVPTFGYVSHQRTLFVGTQATIIYGGFLQGMSGGPLLDLKGRVVGVVRSTGETPTGVDLGGSIPWQALRQLPRE
jgi:S1-C subfamily serine protease